MAIPTKAPVIFPMKATHGRHGGLKVVSPPPPAPVRPTTGQIWPRSA